MDRVLNPRDEKQTIYEIYRACRLCGTGAGYKMPIIQNVIDLDGDGVELRQKIKECVQIDVHHTDRMPPLICELCVDKVNEFYEFLNMCKRNNNKTRLRLGLPLQIRTSDLIDSENCILGMTEPVFIESETESNKTKNKKAKIKKEPADGKIKMENARPSPKPEHPRSRESRESSEEPRWPNSSRYKKRAPSPHPKRATRQNADVVFIPQNEDELLRERTKLKRPREKETKDTPPPNKKVKTAPEPVKVSKTSSKPPEPVRLPKPGPKSMKNTEKEPKEPQKPPQKPTPAKPASKKDGKSPPNKSSKAVNAKTSTPKALDPKALTPKALDPKALTSKALTPKALDPKALTSKASTPKALASKALTPKALDPKVPKPFYCQICKIQTKTSQGFAQHNTKHIPTFTSPKHACNACELWFTTVEETNNHHKNHRTQNIPYKCTRCYGYFKLIQAYEEHFDNALCLSVYEVPDVKCWECWKTFPTSRLLEEHKCAGEDGRPGGKCSKCKRSYALLKNLVKHESSCTHKKKGEVTVDPAVQARLLPMQVRVARCDPLITGLGHVDTSKVSHEYGLDSKCRYPYLTPIIQVKAEPSLETFNHMVSINEDIKEEFSQSFVHWDSDSDSESVQKKVNSLSAISLKTIFSKKCLGKVRKRKRVIKSESLFDTGNDDFCLAKKINSIIDNLDEEDAHTNCSCDSDSILDKSNAVDGSDSKNDSNKLVNHATDGSEKNGSEYISQSFGDSDTACSDSDITDKTNHKSDDKVEDSEVGDTTDKISVKCDDATDKCDLGSDKLVISNELDDTSENSDVRTEKFDDSTEKLDDTPAKCDEAPEKLDDTPAKCDEAPEKLDDTPAKCDEAPEKLDATPAKCDETTEKLDDTPAKCNEAPDKLDDTPEKDDGTPEVLETDNISANTETAINSIGAENCEESIEHMDNNKLLIVENGAALNDENINDEEMHDNATESDNKSLNEDNSNQNVDTITQNHDENEQSKVNNDSTDNRQLEDFNETEIDRLKNDNDNSSHSIVNNTQIASTAEKVIDDIKNDNTKDASIGDSITNLDKSSENNENFSKINEITNKILKENDAYEDKHQKFDNNDDNHHKSDSNVDTISLNSLKSENGMNTEDKFNVNDLSEDDRQLMAELDAQIGENDKKINENDQNFLENDQKMVENDQKSKDNLINELLRKQDSDLRSLDLDSISDEEFNFDM